MDRTAKPAAGRTVISESRTFIVSRPEELTEGNREPQERHRAITDRYGTYEQALWVFFKDIATSNYLDYFGELRQLELFNGP